MGTLVVFQTPSLGGFTDFPPVLQDQRTMAGVVVSEPRELDRTPRTLKRSIEGSCFRLLEEKTNRSKRPTPPEGRRENCHRGCARKGNEVYLLMRGHEGRFPNFPLLPGGFPAGKSPNNDLCNKNRETTELSLRFALNAWNRKKGRWLSTADWETHPPAKKRLSETKRFQRVMALLTGSPPHKHHPCHIYAQAAGNA